MIEDEYRDPNRYGVERIDVDAYDPIRGPADEAAMKAGYYWDKEEALRVQGFIETMCRLCTGEWAGQLIKLMGYQQAMIWAGYGWRHEDTGLRRFREIYWEIGKKNGKSPLIGALGLYHLVADGEKGPEVYLNASTRDQTNTVWEPALRMVEQDEELNEILRLLPSTYKILYPERNGKLVANSAEAGSKDGVQSSCTINDELHRWPNRKMWDVFQHAGRSRRQPMMISITTAGELIEGHPCYQQHQRALRVENGATDDLRFLGIIHGPRMKNPDINDRRIWRMANPAIGRIFTEDDVAESLTKAKREGPQAVYEFKRLILNIWDKAIPKWLDMQEWEAQPSSRTDEEIEESGDIWCAGLDMSSVRDLTSYVRVAGNARDGIDVRAFFWIPETTATKRQMEEVFPYRDLADQGYVSIIPGDVIDPLVIRDFILADFDALGGAKRHRRLHCDTFNSSEVANACDAHGIDFKFFDQQSKYFHGPLKAIEQMISRRVLRHGRHPILTYCAGNAAVWKDNGNENMKLVKHKSSGRIDGMVALAEAVAGILDVIGYAGDGGEEAKKPKPITSGKVTWLS